MSEPLPSNDLVSRLRTVADLDDGLSTTEQADVRLAADEIERLTRELYYTTQAGVIECAVRNPAVSEYMRHWEGRAEKAEAERDRLRAALEEAVLDIESWGAYASEYFQDKHDLKGCLARHKAVLAGSPSETKAGIWCGDRGFCRRAKGHEGLHGYYRSPSELVEWSAQET